MAAPSGTSTAYSRRILFTVRLIAGTMLAGCVSVLTGVVDMKVYQDEVEYARETTDRERFKSHRCNDRLADFLSVIESEDANTWRDFRPSFKSWWTCMRSPVGREPATPYFMLTARDKQYVPLAKRSPEALAALAASGQGQGSDVAGATPH